MGFFSRLFSRGTPANTSRTLKEQKTDSGIRYDANLVPSLKKDHQQLLGLYGQIKQAAEQGQYALIPAKLRELKHALQSHLVVENVRFYVYVQQHMAADGDASSLIADLRKEMDGIARAAVQFINHYETTPFTAEVAATFLKELGDIGAVLVQRINTEESRLYTLYMPSY